MKKKIYRYRFYLITLAGLILIFSNINNAKSDFKLLLWGIGWIIADIGIYGQLILAPNFEKDE